MAANTHVIIILPEKHWLSIAFAVSEAADWNPCPSGAAEQMRLVARLYDALGMPDLARNARRGARKHAKHAREEKQARAERQAFREWRVAESKAARRG